MAEATTQTTGAGKDVAEGGSYEVLRARLQARGQELGTKADALNARRKEVFGGTELAVVGNVRVRTENACKPVEIVGLGELLLIGYSVYIGLKSEVTVNDVFSLHRFVATEDGFDFPAEPLSSGGGFLSDETFLRQLRELFQYYKNANLIQLSRSETKLLAIFQVGATPQDVKVFRWTLADPGNPGFIDDRGERDHVFPPAHDFEWIPTTREHQVQGKFPHVSIEDAVFVETVGGDLTIKVENNTEDGLGIYSEPVDDANQSLDDAQISYARRGELYLLRVLPFREERYRYFVFNKRTASAVRIDAVGQACVSLPEDHGIIFPGGYYLQSGEYKVFEGDAGGLEFQRAIRSPNGEDVLYVFLRRAEGNYVLFPYNLIRKEVQTPIHCHAYTIFGDGKMPVFRVVSDEPTRVHPLQIWQTPFTSAELAPPPQRGSYLAKVGNAELVRGISDAYGLGRLIERQRPSRQTYEEVVATAQRLLDGYYWLGHGEAEDLAATLQEIRQAAELVVDEFEKVVVIRARADRALEESRRAFAELGRSLRADALRDVDAYMRALTALRHQRGLLTGLREMRYMDLPAVDELEKQIAAEYDRVGAACAEFLSTAAALQPLLAQIQELLGACGRAERTVELKPVGERIQQTTEGLNVLSEIAGGLQAADPTLRTRILEGISEVFAQLNRLRATHEGRRKDLGGREGRAEFAAQFKLLGQNIESALARAGTPEACDEQLSRVMLQLEEVEGRFSEFDDFVAELARRREEAYEAFSGRKQALLEERQRRAQTLFAAADRILEGVGRRARAFASADELNAYFASDPMLVKLNELIGRLRELGDSVKSDELESRLKTARQDALRILRDRTDLFEEGAQVIKLGRHRFSVSTQPVELTMVPRQGAMSFHLTGTDYYSPVEDQAFAATADLWDQSLVSETPAIYRGEFLAASLLFAAEAEADGLARLTAASLERDGLVKLVREAAAERYDEGYERGVHDADAALILERLLALRATSGLLRFSPTPRALACLSWALLEDDEQRQSLSRRARSLGRLRAALGESPAARALAEELAGLAQRTAGDLRFQTGEAEHKMAGRYLLEELMLEEEPVFTQSAGALALKEALLAQLEREGTRQALESDLAALAERPAEALALAVAWVDAFLAARARAGAQQDATPRVEAAVLLLTEGRLPRRTQSSAQAARLGGLLGQHPRMQGGEMEVRLDELLERLGDYLHRIVPRYREYRKLRQALVDREREALRLDEFKPRVLTTFVRNQLINEVYLPLIGDNLAKQLGALGEGKRTDLMGMLLLISPPGYGKTTLMEYVASQLGLVFMKVNGPSLGHGVTSLDPSEAGNATARQEVEKINLAFEMGNNVMLYLDDIQHTNPELLQKFISLCDAQRKVEGVWRGRTRTYDLRGKKLCMVMAGNPYTESGGRFKIPDMLANRADTYNLGDILSGKDDLFALSYLENALTSNPTLAPLAGRAPEDLRLLVRQARGQQVAATELSYPYSAAEIADIVAVLGHLFRVQETLLAVNKEYIRSAAMEQAFRTEPPFQLQGSYRNMNKLAEKVVPALNGDELERLIDDHYQGEAQTLTTGAEQNLLKLAELRGRLTPEQAARWNEIKGSFRRLQRMGGSDEDPVTRVVSQLGDIGDGLGAIRSGLLEAASRADSGRDAEARRDHEALRQTLAKLDEALAKLQRPELDVKVEAHLPQGITDLLDHQVALVERIINPLMLTVTRSIEEGDSMRVSLMALMDDLKRIDQQLKQASPEELQRFKQIRERDGEG